MVLLQGFGITHTTLPMIALAFVWHQSDSYYYYVAHRYNIVYYYATEIC